MIEPPSNLTTAEFCKVILIFSKQNIIKLVCTNSLTKNVNQLSPTSYRKINIITQCRHLGKQSVEPQRREQSHTVTFGREFQKFI